MSSIIKNIRKYINSIDEDYDKHAHKWYNKFIRNLYLLVTLEFFPTGTIQGLLKFSIIVILGVFIVGTILLLLLFGGSYIF